MFSQHFYQIEVFHDQWLIFFPDIYHTGPDYHILQETWYAIIGYCSWYLISSSLQYKLSTLWLFLHLNSETNFQHPVDLIYSQRRDPHHYKSDCVNRLYSLCANRVIQILAYLVQLEVYTILFLSEMSLPRADIFLNSFF